MKLHTVASDGPWTPDAYVPPQDPTPVQTPKPYVLVMLRGFCTEFFDDYSAMEAFAQRCRDKGWPFLRFHYDPVARRYGELFVYLNAEPTHA